MLVMAEATPHPNPPPQGGRGFIALAATNFPSPLEGEGREGGEPRDDSFQENAHG